MNAIGSIFRFTFGEQIRKKSFLITTVILAVALAVLAALPAIIDTVQKNTAQKSESNTGVIYLSDSADLLGTQAAAALQSAFKGYTVQAADKNDLTHLQTQVKSADNKQNDVLIDVQELPDNTGRIRFVYYGRTSHNGPDPDTLSTVLHGVYAAHLLTERGVPANTVAAALGTVSYTVQTGDGSNGMQGFLPAMVLCVLLFITIFSYGVQVATSIASEKTSRVLEILITSTAPSRIVVGKSLAMGAAGLLQLCIALAAGFAGYAASGGGGLSAISFAAFTPGIAVLCVVYFLLGFSLFAMLSAVAGATVTSAEEVQTAVQPITLLGMASFYLAYFGFMAQGAPVSLAASLIPFSAPFSMPGRLMMGAVPWWQVVLSLVFLAAATALIGALSIRLYSSAVLHYGKRLTFAELLRMARRV